MDGQNNTGGSQTVYQAPPAQTGGPPPQQPYYPAPGASKKRIFIIIGIVFVFLLIVVLSIFYVLGKQNKDVGNAELIYWGLWEDEQTFQQVIDDFERKYPTIKVVYQKQDIKAIGKYIDRLNTRITNGTDAPDIFRFHNSWVPQVRGLLLPLPESTVQATQFNQQYYDVIQNDVESGGAYYGIPLGIDTLAMYVNEEIFAAANETPPTTWEDMVRVSRELTVVNAASGQIETSGVALGTFDNIAHAPDIISMLFVQNGADMSDLTGANRLNAEQTLEFYTSFAKGQDAVWNNAMDNSKLAFAKGNVAMYFGYSWDMIEINAINPDLKYKILPVPHLPGRNETIASYWVEGVSVKTKYPKEAFLFLQFLSERQSLEKIFAAQAKTRLIGVPYPRKDMAELLKSDQKLYPFVEQAGTAQSTVFSSDTYDELFTQSFNIALGNSVRAILGNNTTPATALDTLDLEMKRITGEIQ